MLVGLATDIGAVRARALAILTGDRGRSRSLERNDELSDLAQALGKSITGRPTTARKPWRL